MAIRYIYNRDGKRVGAELTGEDAERVNKLLRPSQECLDGIRRQEEAWALAALNLRHVLVGASAG